jgi:phosphoribosyl 1,2-cyclic phosphate phosphodiesterase
MVLNALRTEPHPTHQTIDEAVALAAKIGARETYLIHMSHHAGLHAVVDPTLPEGVKLAYDGLTVEVASQPRVKG